MNARAQLEMVLSNELNGALTVNALRTFETTLEELLAETGANDAVSCTLRETRARICAASLAEETER